ncbi:MAG: aspartate kinase [Planctomycetaceae bacterium]
MSIVVMKFGGTSVADATKVRRAAKRAVEAKRNGKQVVMVVSARGKKTDELVRLAQEITDSPLPREMDMLLSTGEQESVALMAMAIHEMGEQAISFTGAQMGLHTDASHTKARIVRISTTRMREQLDAGNIVIAAGFQGVDDKLNITTLGRGGSDTTATALAAALNANLCEIYTDVEGVFTTDPRTCDDARLSPRISYDEMLELASLGAGVMHSRSIEFAKKYRVPIRVRPSFSDDTGTLIAPEPEDDMAVVAGVALVANEARVSLVDIPDEPGVMQLVFAKMSDRKIPIDMVVQNVGMGGTANVSFTVPQDDLAETLTAASEAVEELGSGSVTQGTNLAKVSVVGAGMRTHTGVACQMFQTLADAGINISIVTTSEIKISVLVSRDECKQAVQVVHKGFGLENVTRANPAVGIRTDLTADAQPVDSNAEEEIVAGLSAMEDIVVSDVHLDNTQSRITISHIPDEPGIVANLFSAVAEGGVMVDMIVQNVARSEGANVSFTVPRDDIDRSLLLIREVLDKWPDAVVSHDREIAKLSVMGIGLRSHTEVGARMFRVLSQSGINVQMINTSEIRISAVITADKGEAARDCLLKEFSLQS